MGPRSIRRRLSRIGSRAIIALGMIGVIAWTFVGSLLMGLTTPQNSQPRTVHLWLGGLVAIVVLSGIAACLAEGPRDG